MKMDGKSVMVLAIILMTVISYSLVTRVSAEVDPVEAYSAGEFGGDSQACYRACTASSQYTRPECERMCFPLAAPAGEQSATYPATAVVDPPAVSAETAYPVAYPVYVGTGYPVDGRPPLGDNTGGTGGTEGTGGTDTKSPGTDTKSPTSPGTDTKSPTSPGTDTKNPTNPSTSEPTLQVKEPQPVEVDWARSSPDVRAEYISYLEGQVTALKSVDGKPQINEQITKLEAEIAQLKAVDAKGGSDKGSTSAQSQKAQVDSMVKNVQDKLNAQSDKSQAGKSQETSVRSTSSASNADSSKKTTTQASGAGSTGDSKKGDKSAIKGTSQGSQSTSQSTTRTGGQSSIKSTPQGAGDKSRITQGASQGRLQTAAYRQGAQQTQPISRFGQAGQRQYAPQRTTAAYPRPMSAQMTMGPMGGGMNRR